VLRKPRLALLRNARLKVMFRFVMLTVVLTGTVTVGRMRMPASVESNRVFVMLLVLSESVKSQALLVRIVVLVKVLLALLD